MLLITKKREDVKSEPPASVAITAEMLEFIKDVAEDTNHTCKEIAMAMLEYARRNMTIAPEETRTLEEIKASPEFIKAKQEFDDYMDGLERGGVR